MEQLGRVLIVDDSDQILRIACKILEPMCEIETATSGEECLALFRSFEPDLILLDIMMPGISGLEVCRQIKSSPCGPFTHVILLSAKGSTQERNEGYRVHADDYIVKPFDHEELRSRIRIQFRLHESQLKVWELTKHLQIQNTELEIQVAQRAKEIIDTQDITVFALAQLADSRDPETGEHLMRLRSYSQILAEELRRRGPYQNQIDEDFLRDLYRASPLHDIGKVGILDSILRKPGRLTADETEQMKQHVIIGAETLDSASHSTTGGSFLAMAAEVARFHHERWDGSGYCLGISRLEIPLAARIVALADVYDALVSKRVYKDAMSPKQAYEIIVAESGKHFDPAVVSAYQRSSEKFLKVPDSVSTQDNAMMHV